MPDWFTLDVSVWTRGDWLSLGQLVFTVLGFWLAIQQLKRTATEAETTNKKLEGLRARMASNDLLVALPALQKIEDDLDKALKSKDESAVVSGLTAYARSATEVVATIGARPDIAEDELVKSLAQVAKAATKTRGQLSKGVPPDLTALVLPVMTKMFAVSPEISAVIARLQREVDVR